MSTLSQGISTATTLELKPPPPRSTAAPADWAAWFEELYRAAGSDASRVPWNAGLPNPALVSWLNAEGPGLIRTGASVTVVGCGLGHDVAELAGRGFDAIGFDVSPAAIDWARRLHPEIADRLQVADLFSLPSHLRRRADLVVEIYTIQSMCPSLREATARAIVSLARPRGIVLTIARARDHADPLPSEPPFALSREELTALMAREGLAPLRELDDFTDDETPPKRRLRGAFRRP